MNAGTRMALAVVLAGVAGALANAVTVAATIEGAAFLSLATNPARLAVAVAVAALLPVIAARVVGALQGVTSVGALTVIPSLLAKLVFAAAAPWSLALLLNAVYAVVAWMVYRAVMYGVPEGR